jgi:hypothetical protein
VRLGKIQARIFALATVSVGWPLRRQTIPELILEQVMYRIAYPALVLLFGWFLKLGFTFF